MATYDLGKVVGDPGEKGDDGSSVWNTSTAPTYANSKYTFTISNLNGKSGIDIAVNDIIFYSTYYYIVSTVNSTTVDCTTRVSIKGSDASVTIVDNLTSDSSTSALSAKQGKALNTNKVATSAIATSWGSTTSDSKVPSEKLAKDTLDGKQATLVSGTNIKTINNNSLLGSGNIDIQGSSVDIVTSWESTPSDSKVASEKLTKDTLDTKINTSSIADNLTTNDSTKVLSAKQGYLLNTAKLNISQSSAKGKNVVVNSTSGFIDFEEKPTVPTKVSDLTNDSGFITSSALSNYVQKSSTSGLMKNDGSVMTGGTGSSNWAIGNHTHSSYVSATKVTSWSSTVSDSNVPSEKLTKDSLDNKVSKSSTSGLLKNDGSVMSSGTGASNWAIGNHTHDDRYYTETEMDTALAKKVSKTKFTEEDFVNPINWEDGDGNTRPTYNSDKELVWANTGLAVFAFSDDNQLQLPPNYHMSFTFDPQRNSTLYMGADAILSNPQTSYDVEIVCSNNVATVTTTPTTSTFSYNTAIQDIAIVFIDGLKISNFTFTEFYPTSDVFEYNALSNIGTSSGATQSSINSAIDTALSNKISKSSTSGLMKNDGSVMTGGTGSSNYAIGNHTHGLISADGEIDTTNSYNGTMYKLIGFKSDATSKKIRALTNVYGRYVVDNTAHSNIGSSVGSHQETINGLIDTALGSKLTATKVTSWSSTVSDSNVPSEKLVKDYVDGLVGSAIQYIVGSGS